MLKHMLSFLLLTSLMFIYSCDPALTKLKNITDCTSVIEGAYYSQLKWGGKAPALLYKEDHTLKVAYGTVLEEKEDGFLFKQSSIKDSSASSTLFFLKEKTTAIINKDRDVIYGEVDKKFLRAVNPFSLILVLDKVKSTNRFYKELVLKPNETFAYCLKPGDYIIKDMYFENEYNNLDMGVNFPNIPFKVLENHTTYIGDLYLDDTRKPGGRIVIPYINLATQEGLLAAGISFGLIGEIAYYTIKNHLDPDDIHIISVVKNKNFVKKSKLNLNIDWLHVPDSAYNVESFPLHEIRPQKDEPDTD